MNTTTITNSPIPIIAAILIAFILLEIACACFRQPRGQRRDVIIEILGSSLLMGVTLPLVTFLSSALLGYFAPQLKGSLSALHWTLGLALFLVLDDMTQYWWHRASHSPLLWPLHRAHHSAQYMSIRVTFRNNFFYTVRD